MKNGSSGGSDKNLENFWALYDSLVRTLTFLGIPILLILYFLAIPGLRVAFNHPSPQIDYLYLEVFLISVIANLMATFLILAVSALHFSKAQKVRINTERVDFIKEVAHQTDLKIGLRLREITKQIDDLKEEQASSKDVAYEIFRLAYNPASLHENDRRVSPQSDNGWSDGQPPIPKPGTPSARDLKTVERGGAN